MEIGKFERETESAEIRGIAERVLPGVSVGKICRVCEQYGERAEECREYDVYRLITDAGELFLKKSDAREAENYEKYLSRAAFRVPKYFGKTGTGGALWIALEAIEGEDLRDMTEERAIAAARSLAEIQNYFWNSPDTARFEAYLERIGRRYAFVKDDPVLGPAYLLFMERQKTCARTMSNGDLLQFNAVERDGEVYILDWGFGGVMPYSLDIARFLAHATEDRATFPFYMTSHQKAAFMDEVYGCLKEKPSLGQFTYDLELAVLNEYVEFMEADEDDDHWYAEHADWLAKHIVKRSRYFP